ncbi:hypothetical protein BJ973_003886 [Actinoplanes tereljensis]|uniref:Patatin-like phospholipase n=1 Tax=Paractinoplanes tereljensis TaxID=571912 RepID=A0A919TW61_9ACTN|nr:hypothetical protein [Actinoplanes tereljensis]GIF25608.1 hypothetical protein Ate02nite_83380 [Actinoplanes tereljensis]
MTSERELPWWLAWPMVLLGAVASIVMGEAAGLLNRLQLAGQPHYGAGSLTGWPGLPWAHREITAAITAWSDRTAAPGLRDQALLWVHVYLVADLVFIAAYGTLLIAALLTTRYNWAAIRRLVLPVAVLDLAETLWTWLVVGDLGGAPNGAAATVLAVLTALKWVALAIAVGAVLLKWLTPEPGPQPPGKGPRIWRRHRVQMVAVALLFLVFAAPLHGPLDQIQDIVRAWLQKGFPLGAVAGPLAGTVLLCVALWVAGRWALLDGVDEGSEREHEQWRPSLIAGGIVAGLCLVLWLVPGIDMGLNLLGVALLLVAAGGASYLVTTYGSELWLFKPSKTASDRGPEQLDRPGDDWARVRYVGRLLAVAPLVALGMLLVRAFSGMAMVPRDVLPLHDSAVDQEVTTGDIWVWLIVGGLLVAAVAPLAAWGIATAEKRWLDRENTTKAQVRVPNVVGIVVLVIGVAATVAGTLDPRWTGQVLRVIGLIATLGATLVIAFGWMQRRVELHRPAPVFRRLDRTPVLILSIAALMIAAQFDAGRYHAVHVGEGDHTSPPAGNALDASFRSWLGAVRDGCLPAAGATAGGRPAVPLVLVAAPGGGARAAYWTAAALDDLTNPELQKAAVRRADPNGTGVACGERALFAISGVSGGSVGAAAWAVAKYGATTAGVPTNSELVTGAKSVSALIQEDPLAAGLAAGLYRDFPRILHGVDGYRDHLMPDRARTIEEGWEHENPAMAADMMTMAPAGQPWRPLLMFNGTAVETGCRVVVGPIPAAVTAHQPAEKLKSCRAAAGPTTAGRSGLFAVGALDARDYLGRQTGDGCETADDATFRLSTAALLSARFPYITPTGSLVFCPEGGGVSKTFDVDGGYLENNGIALALDLWRALEPMVAEHNRTASGTDPLVAPMLVVLDNHYQSAGAAQAADRPVELVAPVTAYLAPRQAQTDPIMLQDALMELSGPLPGLAQGQLRVGRNACADSRVFRVAPNVHPGVEAPLGWVLSRPSQQDLRSELDKQVVLGDLCRTASDPVAGDDDATTPATGTVPALEPGQMAPALQMMGGALNVP